MKPGLVSPDFIYFQFHFKEILLAISETAIPDLFRKYNIFIKSSMILRTFNAVFKLSYATEFFYCSGAF